MKDGENFARYLSGEASSLATAQTSTPVSEVQSEAAPDVQNVDLGQSDTPPCPEASDNEG
jgi:hypothetical protein